jgi:hypothetical protein
MIRWLAAPSVRSIQFQYCACLAFAQRSPAITLPTRAAGRIVPHDPFALAVRKSELRVKHRVIFMLWAQLRQPLPNGSGEGPIGETMKKFVFAAAILIPPLVGRTSSPRLAPVS